MFNVNRRLKGFTGMIIFVLSLFIISATGEGEMRSDGSGKESDSNRGYSLTIKEDLITLSASNASLREILEEIGNRMKIDVVTHIRHNETISLEFDNLSLEESIKRLSTNHVYLMDSEREKGRITKIVILPKGQEKVSTSRIKEQTMSDTSSQAKTQKNASSKSSEPEPFKFEFDPSMFLKEKK